MMMDESPPMPFDITLDKKSGFASFTQRQHPANRIGYRFFEHSPLVFGAAPEAGVAKVRRDAYEEDFSNRRGVEVYRQRIPQVEGWVDQSWTFYLAPAQHGIDLLWLVETQESGLPRYYGVQQCFRLSGVSNAAWRREIAETPAFSEYDLWASQDSLPERASLTYVLRKNVWHTLPAVRECVGARTPLGVRIDAERFGRELPDVVGPYNARMLDPVDCGLITRTNLQGAWVCGLFWEGTSHVTDHHPADCLHAIVNIGDLPPHSRRVIRGKIYWFKGTKQDLLEQWRADF